MSHDDGNDNAVEWLQAGLLHGMRQQMWEQQVTLDALLTPRQRAYRDATLAAQECRSRSRFCGWWIFWHLLLGALFGSVGAGDEMAESIHLVFLGVGALFCAAGMRSRSRQSYWSAQAEHWEAVRASYA